MFTCVFGIIFARYGDRNPNMDKKNLSGNKICQLWKYLDTLCKKCCMKWTISQNIIKYLRYRIDILCCSLYPSTLIHAIKFQMSSALLRTEAVHGGCCNHPDSPLQPPWLTTATTLTHNCNHSDSQLQPPWLISFLIYHCINTIAK